LKKKRIINKDSGNAKYEELDLRKLLLLKYQLLTNKSQYVGEFDIPSLYCNTSIYPDYIALYSEKSYYHKTEFTAVGFFEYDIKFDGQHGLFNAIYYDNKKDLERYKKRFEGVKFVFTPDYSLLEDSDEVENLYRLKKMRVIALWFIHVIGAIVIPLISFPSLKSIDYYLDGLEKTTVVGISTKGHIDEDDEYKRLCATIKYLVETKHNLKAIVVYDVCGDQSKTNKAFEPAEEAGIKVIIPPNSLKMSNESNWRKRHGSL
jgi:hypothetical protein